MLPLYCFFLVVLSGVNVHSFLPSIIYQKTKLSIAKLTATTENIQQNDNEIQSLNSLNRNALQQLSLQYNCDEIDSDTISEFLFELGSLSVSCEVETERTFPLEEKKWSDIVKTKNWQIALLKANFPLYFDLTSLTEVIELTYPEIHFEFKFGFVEDRDWITHVQSSWNPMVVGDLMISFPWHEQSQPDNDKLKHLVLEGGAAFGTGDHPTTRLCLRWIQKSFSDSTGKLSGSSLLDYGCGSAILGLAGLKYGAAKAAGVDIDIDSLISARWNAERNKLAMSLYLAAESEDGDHVGEGPLSSDEERSVVLNQFKGRGPGAESFPSVDDLPFGKFDVLVANILAPILMHLAPQFAKYLRKSGDKIALSGVLASQADRVMEVYANYFDNVIIEEEEDGWVIISGQLK